MFFYLQFIIKNKQLMIKVNIFFAILLFLVAEICIAQPAERKFTHADTLRGSVTPERAWWDVMRYDIDVKPDYNNKTIEGENDITFKVTGNGNKMQIDLQGPLEIQQIEWGDKVLGYTREGNVFFVKFPLELRKGNVEKIKIYYHGKTR